MSHARFRDILEKRGWSLCVVSADCFFGCELPCASLIACVGVFCLHLSGLNLCRVCNRYPVSVTLGRACCAVIFVHPLGWFTSISHFSSRSVLRYFRHPVSCRPSGLRPWLLFFGCSLSCPGCVSYFLLLCPLYIFHVPCVSSHLFYLIFPVAPGCVELSFVGLCCLCFGHVRRL